MDRPLLVYDGSRRVFRAIAEAVASCAAVTPVRWESKAVQDFLTAQFGDGLFVFALIDGDTVYVGDEAVRELLEQFGVPAVISRRFAWLYVRAGGPFGRIVHGRTPADIHGSFPVNGEAQECLAAVRQTERE